MISNKQAEGGCKFFGVSFLKPRLRGRIIAAYGEKAYSRLILLEEKFAAAILCAKRLKDRNKRYGKLKFDGSLWYSSAIRRLHADEYFFFTCCGFIHKEISLIIKYGILEDFPEELLAKLKVLSEERRYHEHGKDWYWGELRKGQPPASTNGDNFDFNKNREALKVIYSYLVSKVDLARK